MDFQDIFLQFIFYMIKAINLMIKVINFLNLLNPMFNVSSSNWHNECSDYEMLTICTAI